MIDDAHFRSPAREFRPVPMWFWNGDIDAAEVRRQVQLFAEGGLGGFQIAARTGLTTPYLSQRWFDLVNLAGQEARRHGLQMWLADEYPYPSGAVGGELTLRHPEYRAWHMRARSLTVAAGERLEALVPGSIMLYATAVPVYRGKAGWKQALDLREVVGVTQPEPVFTEPAFGLSKKRYFTFNPRPKLDWTAPAGDAPQWQVWLIAASEVSPFKFFGFYVDLCNPDAVRAFLDATYERYAERLEPEVWKQLSGFFLDESHPSSWSWSLPDAFRRRNGYDLVPHLPALWTDIGPETTAIRYDYWQTLTGRFMESFHRPLAEWCRNHGVQLSLEVDSLRNQVQRYADIGGNDPGHEKVGWSLDALHERTPPRFRAHPRFPASLASQVGQQRVLVECYHSIGWSITLQDMKALADRLAAQGANLFVFHAFFYSIGGLRKWDAPPSQFWQHPFWPHFPRFTDYLGRLCYALTRGRRVAPVVLLDPITSLWTHGGNASNGGIGPRDEVAKRIAADWQYLQRELEAAQRPFDSLDPLLLAEGQVEGGTLRLAEATYHVLVLPPMASLEAAAWQKLEEFAASGGTVIACGLLPYEQIERGSDVVAQCAAAFGAASEQARRSYEAAKGGGVSTHQHGRFLFVGAQGTLAQARAAGHVLAILDKLVPPSLAIQPDGGAGARRDFLISERQEGLDTLYFVANAGNTEQNCDLTISHPEGSGGLTVERLDLEDGSRAVLPSAPGPGGKHVIRLAFPRYGAHLLLVRPGDAPKVPSAPALPEITVPVDGHWECALANDNALRLDRFRFGIVPEPAPDAAAPTAADDWPLVEPKPLVNTLRELQQAGQPWPLAVRVETPFGSTARLQLDLPATACYVATFDVATMPSRAALCLEAPAILGDWRLWLNGQPIPTEAFAPRVRWDVTNQEVDVLPLLRPGQNTLTVCVTVREQTDGLVDALYLLGDFGVRASVDVLPEITALPQKVRVDALHADGLPYFAGPLRLTRSVTLPSVPTNSAVTVRLPDDVLMFAGIAELTINGHQLGVRPWTPFRWQAPAGVLREGANEVTLSITTGLAGLLEGKRYDPALGDSVRVEEA